MISPAQIVAACSSTSSGEPAASFRWFNTGLTNAPSTEGEYPAEFLYRDVLSKESVLEAVSFFLVHVPGDARRALAGHGGTA